MVAEDPSVAYPDLETAKDGTAENVEDAGVGQQPTQPNYKSPGGISAFSGTTARISFPAQELTEISPEDMLDTLPDLSDASEKLLSLVIPDELSEVSVATTMAQLQNKDTRENKKLKRLGDTFERQRKEYGGGLYINVGETLRRLLGRKAGPIDEQTASWRPDALLQKANIAILVSRLLSIAEQDQKDKFLEETADNFPRPFAQRFGLPESLTPECSALVEATFRMALELRTQEAIMLLAHHVGKINFDPDTALLQVFYDGNNLKGWAFDGLRIAELSREAEDTIRRRVEQMRKAFIIDIPMTSDGQSSVVESLLVNFPWTTFTHQMVAWASQRLTEIQIQTTPYGGAQAICRVLIDLIQSGRLVQSLEIDDVDESDGPQVRLEYNTPIESRATSEQQDASTRPARADEFALAQFRSVDTLQSWILGSLYVLILYNSDDPKSRSATTILKQRQADRKVTESTEQISLPRNQETASDVQVASTAGPAMQALTPQRSFNEQDISSPAPASVPNRQAPSADQDDNWGYEDNEEEESDIETARNAQASLAYRKQREAESNKENVAEIPESQQPKKRTMYDRDPLGARVSPVQDPFPISQESDISSDQGFQVQAESSNAAMQRGLKPATKRPASNPATLQRRSPKKVRVQENIDAHTLDGSADVARDQQETQPQLSQAGQEYIRVNESAKQKMAVVTKPPQRRSAWTGVETDMLYYLITEHGTSWKLLKEQDREQGHVLEARDQVALKDKARNMKMDYLKYVYKLSDLSSKLTRQQGRVESSHRTSSAFRSATRRLRD